MPVEGRSLPENNDDDDDDDDDVMPVEGGVSRKMSQFGRGAFLTWRIKTA